MDTSQRRVVALAAYAIAVVLMAIFFLKPFWAWATWNESKNTLDLGFIKVTNRPPFPSDGKSVGLGLIAPIVLAAAARVVESGKKA